jgi:hypothetical protein
MKFPRLLLVLGCVVLVGVGALFAAEAKDQKTEKPSCCEAAKEKEKDSKSCCGQGCCSATKDGDKSEKTAEKKG